MKFETVMQLIGQWGGTLKFFPGDAEARIGIAESLIEMASSEEQVRWLVKRLPKLFTEWPAMHEVRAVFCSKFKPADGVEVYSEVYLEGIPAEKEQRQYISAATPLQIEGSCDPVSEDPEMLALVQKVKEAHVARMPTVQVDVTIRHEENELAALTRAVRDYNENHTKVRRVRAVTDAEIDFMKSLQDANRKEPVGK